MLPEEETPACSACVSALERNSAAMPDVHVLATLTTVHEHGMDAVVSDLCERHRDLLAAMDTAKPRLRLVPS